MTNPGLPSQKERDEVASTLRRWRQYRDLYRAKHNQEKSGTQVNREVANLYANRLDGFREALEILCK